MARKLAPVKCCYCELPIDRNTEPYGRPLKELGSTELNPRRYAHQHCGEQYNWMPVTEFNRLKTAKKIKEEAEKNGRTVTEQKAKTKKCLYCNKMIDLDTDDACLVGVGTRWAHKECYEKYFSADDQWIDKLYGILKVVFGKYDFQKIERQRITFIKQGLTNEDIYNALNYWYIVKNKSIEKANGGIGIVPYIYEDANEYFKSIEKSSQKINPATFKMGSKIVDIDFSKEKKVETEDEKKQRIASIHGWDLSFSNPELYKDLE